MPEPRFSVLPAGVRPAEDGASMDDAMAVLGALRDVMGKSQHGASATLLQALAVLLYRSHHGDLVACHRSADAMPRLMREMLASLPSQGVQ